MAEDDPTLDIWFFRAGAQLVFWKQRELPVSVTCPRARCEKCAWLAGHGTNAGKASDGAVQRIHLDPKPSRQPDLNVRTDDVSPPSTVRRRGIRQRPTDFQSTTKRLRDRHRADRETKPEQLHLSIICTSR